MTFSITSDSRIIKDIGLQLQGTVKKPFLLRGFSLAILQVSGTFPDTSE